MAHRNVVTTDLELLKPLMQRDITLPARIGWDSWKEHEQIRARKVLEYREFADGEHDVELSDEMKNMLRTASLNLNHCENILETLSDRVRLSGVQVSVMNEADEPDEAATDDANKWVQNLTQEWNRLDGLQIDLHDAIPRDGMSFILAEYDPDKKRVVWKHEEAFDGHSGVMVVWGDDGQSPSMAIKIWHETQNFGNSKLLDRVRINLFFPDRIEKYVSEGSRLEKYLDDNGDYSYPWVMRDGSPIGVPIIPFVYKGRQYNRHGLGRLENAIPVQRAINRELNSLIMASELLGFPIRYILGGSFPATIRPGTVIEIKVPETITSNGTTRNLTADERAKILELITKVQLGQLPAASLEGLQMVMEKFIIQMYIITGTPFPEGAGAGISGEALKQLDIRLVGTAQRCQTSWGNSYEDLVKLSARIETVYGRGAPWDLGKATVTAKWESAEVRDDSVVISNVKATVEIIPELDVRTRLEMVAPIHGWDNTRIDEIEQRIADAGAANLERELNALGNGGFGGFGQGVTLDDPLNGRNGAGDNPLGLADTEVER